MEVKIVLPLFVMLPRKTIKDKKYIVNLNNFPNTHRRTLAEAKIEYAKLVEAAVSEVHCFKKAKLHFRYFHGNKRKMDKSNPCCIIEKFACDALTKLGFWEDDHSEIIPETTYTYCGVDKENPRCELTITEIK